MDELNRNEELSAPTESADRSIESLVFAGLDSEAIEGTPEFWTELEAEAAARLDAAKKGKMVNRFRLSCSRSGKSVLPIQVWDQKNISCRDNSYRRWAVDTLDRVWSFNNPQKTCLEPRTAGYNTCTFLVSCAPFQ